MSIPPTAPKIGDRGLADTTRVCSLLTKLDARVAAQNVHATARKSANRTSNAPKGAHGTGQLVQLGRFLAASHALRERADDVGDTAGRLEDRTATHGPEGRPRREGALFCRK